MIRTRWMAPSLVLLWTGAAACAFPLLHRGDLDRANRNIRGLVHDYTANHGSDRRIWSPSLCQRRDLYVYVPPCFDPHRRYPLMLWLHGFAQDELSFLHDVVAPLDRAISSGKLPPLVVAAPDGSFRGTACLSSAGSFYLNSKAGCFEDYLMRDVNDFVHRHYPILPERDAHVLAGVSMGGGAAYHNAIKYSACWRVVVGIFPPLNARWESCRGRYRDNYDPCCQNLRTDFTNGKEVVGRFYGVFTIRQRQVLDPLYDRYSPDVAAWLSEQNPMEMLDKYDVREGQLAMYVAYGGKDQFNLDAQVESFLEKAKCRGLTVAVAYDPRGRHDRATALKFVPGVIDWLGKELAAYRCP